MTYKKLILIVWGVLFVHVICLLSKGFSQQEGLKRDQYQIGPDERLLITVHILGEVKNPGEYLVPDDTNLLEIISKAGGPTEFSNLSKIKITRGLMVTELKEYEIKKKSERSTKGSSSAYDKKVLKVNLQELLDDVKCYELLPILQPGDVIRIGKNNWYTWQTIIRVISQIAIVAQVWWYWSRYD